VWSKLGELNDQNLKRPGFWAAISVRNNVNLNSGRQNYQKAELRRSLDGTVFDYREREDG